VSGDSVRKALAAAEREGDRNRGLLSDFVCQEAAKAIETEVLEVDAFHLLARAWAGVAEVRRYRNETLKEPDAKRRVAFAAKTLKAPQKIELKLEIAGLPALTLELTIDLKVAFESVGLTVARGKVTEAEFGKSSASVALKYRDVELVPAKKTDSIKLGRKQFDPALEIP
jgi:hypothetical protein